MPIDIIFLVLVIMAVFKGISRGLIVALFSFAAIMIGLAAAVRFSVSASAWLKDSFNVAPQWLPVFSFALVMICVILLVRLAAKFVETAIQFAMLGWLNKLGGALLYILLYTGIFSILLFYFTKMNLIGDDKIAASLTYKYIEPFGTKAVDLIGSAIPFFKNMFGQLTDFFNSISSK
jgi:membrane protein required for colicin V production